MSVDGADATHRHLALKLVAHRLLRVLAARRKHLLQPARVDVARADGVDVDAIRRHLERQCLGIADHRRPSVATERPNPAIGWIAEIAVMLRMLPPPRLHVRHRPRAPSARRTSSSARSPFAQAASSKPADLAERRRAIVVDEDVDAAEAARPLSTTRSQSSARRQSACTGNTSAPVSRAIRCAAARKSGLAARSYRDARTLCRERTRDAITDALLAPPTIATLSRKIEIHVVLHPASRESARRCW